MYWSLLCDDYGDSSGGIYAIIVWGCLVLSQRSVFFVPAMMPEGGFCCVMLRPNLSRAFFVFSHSGKTRWWTLNSTLGYANKKALIFIQIAFISRPEIDSFHVINKITLAKTYDMAFNFPKILAKTILTNQKANPEKKEGISLLIA